LVVIAGNDAQFRKLCEVLGVPELVDDPRFTRNQDRTANRADLMPFLVDRLQSRSSREWFDLLLAAGVPCAPIQTIDAGVRFADEVGLEPVVEVGPEALPMVRHPITFSQTPARYELAPPALDQHGAEIRAWLADSSAARAVSG
jgi:crotonobetainyl-CoA:carnitine CoA-transferase CaiB-like acyl-CoA transferase